MKIFIILEENAAGEMFPKTYHSIAASEEEAKNFIRAYALRRYGNSEAPTALVIYPTDINTK